jgi:hypothetical protein
LTFDEEDCEIKMISRKLLLLLVVVCGFLGHIECQKKKSSSKLKQMMEQKLIDDKVLNEKWERERKEKGEREANKFKPGYFVGRILPETFEYKGLNQEPWMTPNEAARICENDLKCAGFTFRGSTELLDLPTNIHFVHHFPKYLLDEPEGYSAYWVSYRAKRPFVVLKGWYLVAFNLGKKITL